MPLQAPYGSWASPVSSQTLTEKSISISQLRHENTALYWVESRPEERGRNCIVQYCNNAYRDITPSPINVRTRVHEYGGQAYCVHDDIVYFSCHDDQRIYKTDTRCEPSRPEALTAENLGSFADHFFDTVYNRLLCIREAPAQKTDAEPVASIVAIDPVSGEIQTLISGDDFYANIQVSPDGKHMSWLSWNHPAMPWDDTTLWLADIDHQGLPSAPRKIADNSNVSLFQPQWGLKNDIFFVSDQSGWWNIHRYYLNTGEEINLLPMEAEFGLPQWVFGMSTYQVVDEDTLACCYTADGEWQLALLSISKNKLTPLADKKFNWFSDLHYMNGNLVYLCGNSFEPPILVMQSIHKTADKHMVEKDEARKHVLPHRIQLRNTSPANLPQAYFSIPEKITFSTGEEQHAHAFFYPPKNPDYKSAANEKPPLIVLCHGGPTGATEMLYNLKIQFWTSRGFAVVDVNYRGSTGYGRHYRDSLKGQWGIADVEDCVNAARYLVEQNRVDPERLAIKGSSAGGFTVLCALTFHDIFKAGASYYGIGDLDALLKDTHKFESRYLDSLIAPYPAQAARYHERSPINFSEQLNCPCIFLQGMKDRVVPPNQAKKMVEALKKQNIPVALVLFDDEAHGFRQAANIQKAIEAELYFYARVFGFAVADKLEPINIHN
ncbi:MAG: S9 family peptidase, partial [Pseudomonadales bacterium]|nr:S9 family peptidase [Pseudomonadales bacterium]